MSIPIHIAIYTISTGNYHHWAIYVTPSQSESHVYEVVSEHPTFQYNHIVITTGETDVEERNAQESCSITTQATTAKCHDGQHKEDILVGYITPRDMSCIDTVLTQVQIDNDNPGWCCQDWVLEALEVLCEEFFLDEADELYASGTARAKDIYFGQLI